MMCKTSHERITVASTHVEVCATQAGIHFPRGNTNGSTLYYLPQEVGTTTHNDPYPPASLSQTPCLSSANFFIKLTSRLTRHRNLFAKCVKWKKRNLEPSAPRGEWKPRVDCRHMLRETRRVLEASNFLYGQGRPFCLFCSKTDGPGEKPVQWAMDVCRLLGLFLSGIPFKHKAGRSAAFKIIALKITSGLKL